MRKISLLLAAAVLLIAACADQPTAPAPAITTMEPPGVMAVLLDARHAASIQQAPNDLVLVAHSPALGTARTRACGGTDADYPVQGVIATAATHAYAISIVVCRDEALAPGQSLRLDRTPLSASGGYARFPASIH